MNRAERRRAEREAAKGASATMATEDDIRAMIAADERSKAAQAQRINAARTRAEQCRNDVNTWARAWEADGKDSQLNTWGSRLAWDFLDSVNVDAAIDRWTAATTDPRLLARTAIAALVLVKLQVNVLVDTLEASTSTLSPVADGFEYRATFAENAAAAWEQT